MGAEQVKLKILSNRNIRGNYFIMTLQGGRIARSAQPGQFVMVKVNAGQAPLLRRPLSIHAVQGGRLALLYGVVGPGTRLLSQKRAGERLDVIGPLGNGFDTSLARRPSCSPARLTDSAGMLNGAPYSSRQHPSAVVLVAGGMGIAPLLFLAERLRKHKQIVLLGVKSKHSILCEKEFKKIGCDVAVATEDGSAGFRGMVTSLFEKLLLTIDHRPSTRIYACGPYPMLAAVAQIARRYRIPAFGSFEAHMACGIGACMGCIIKLKTKNSSRTRRHSAGSRKAGKLKTEYKRVCKDGPVFPLNQVVF